MSGYTRFGSAIWSWEPWVSLASEQIERDRRRGRDAQHLWLALYTSPEAKRCVPGLFHGSVHAMADAARMQSDDTWAALSVLLERDMVDFDQTQRVLRLCAPEPYTPLPDPGEFPFNGNAIKSWWSKFRTVPACAVRDAHVSTLRWILEAGAAETEAGQLSANHQAAWDSTFGRVKPTAAHATPGAPGGGRKRRGVRALGETDAATALQPSLFGPPPALTSPDSDSGSDPTGGSAEYRTVPATVPVLVSVLPSASPIPEASSVASPLRSSVSDHSSTSWEPFREPFRVGSRNQQDPDPDQEPDLISSSGIPEGTVVALGSTVAALDGPTRPALVLVPLPLPYTALEMLAAIGRYEKHVLVRQEGLQAALERAIGVLETRGVGPPDLALAGRWIATACPHDPCCGASCETSERGGPRGVPPPEWWCHPDHVQRAIVHARACEEDVRERQEAVAEARRRLGYA